MGNNNNLEFSFFLFSCVHGSYEDTSAVAIELQLMPKILHFLDIGGSMTSSMPSGWIDGSVAVLSNTIIINTLKVNEWMMTAAASFALLSARNQIAIGKRLRGGNEIKMK